MKVEIPVGGVINFYQAIERFERYCKMCREYEERETERKILYSGYARDEIDTAYHEYLPNIPLILVIKEGKKPVPASLEVKTEELREYFKEQLKVLKKKDAETYLNALKNLKEHCPRNCRYDEIKGDVEKIKELAVKIRELVENLYLEDVLEMVKKQLEGMMKEPEKFRNIFMLPPKPLIDEYRV